MRNAGTYKDQPDAGHDGMTIGLDGWRDEKLLERLPGILMLPFNRPIDNRYPINRRRI